MNQKYLKCSHCLKPLPENESDHCENCDQQFCSECLIYCGELAFCEKCK